MATATVITVPPRYAQLTPRQKEIVKLVSEGCYDNNELAREMRISQHTVHNHLGIIYRRLGITGMMQLALFADCILSQGAPGLNGNHPGKILTRREIEILPLLAHGMSNKEIAGVLGLHIQTVKNLVKDMCDRTGFANRIELAIWGTRYVPPESMPESA